MTSYKKIKSTMCLVIALTLVSVSHASRAEVGWVKGAKIVSTLTDTAYAGCMVYLDQLIAQEDGTLSACKSRWLSLDCDSLYHTQAQSNAMWTSALVAFSLQKSVNFYVNDELMVNGYCMARRMDMTR